MAWGRSFYWGGRAACGGRSYHDGGVRGQSFSRWYDNTLSNQFGHQWGRNDWRQWATSREEDEELGTGTGGSGTGGSGSGSGSRGSGTGGSGSGGSGSRGSGTGGSGGSKGSCGSRGSGTGGSGTGRGHHGRKPWWQNRDPEEDNNGSGSGTGGSGSGGSGSRGSGTGGSGSGGSGSRGSGTGGSGSGGSGSRGSGTGGSGSGGSGSRGSGTGGSGSGTGGTGGDDGGGGTPNKPTVTFEIGGAGEPRVTVEVVQTPAGQLYINMQPTSWEGEVADIDGIFFNMTDDAAVGGLNFHPSTNALPVTGHAAEANQINALDTGASVPENYDAMVQFGQTPDTTDGTVTNANFTLWSDNGPLTLDDIDLGNMSLIVTAPDGSQDVLNGGYDAGADASVGSSYTNGGVTGDGLNKWYDANLADRFNSGEGSEEDDGLPSTEDVMALMTKPVPENGTGTMGTGGTSGDLEYII